MSDSITSSTDPSTVVSRFRKIFDPSVLNRLAYKCKLIRRCSSRIKGFEIALALMEKAFNGHNASLSICCDAMAEINPNAEMTVQSLRERINSPQCAQFFKTILLDYVQAQMRESSQELLSKLPPMGKSILHKFATIKALDCTEIALNPSLRESFRGSGGEKNADACLKIFTVYNVTTGSFSKFDIVDRNTPDQTLGLQSKNSIQANELYLMDKGFFSLEFLDSIQSKEASFITPLHGSVNIYRKETDKQPIALAKSVAVHFRKSGYFNQILFLGKNRKPVRVIAFPISEKSKQRKLRSYLKRCRKAGTTPSEESIARQGMTILITNDLSIPAEVIAALYSLRWQVELVFKSWKSQLKIDYCLGTNPERIRVLIYSRLIAISIMALTLSPVGLMLEAFQDKELSLHKAVNWLTQGNRVYRLLRGDPEVIKGLLRAAEKWLCKENNRRRKTTRQRLEEISERMQVA
jgi:hypothetical protein